MRRRTFLKTLASAPLALGASRLFAAPAGGAKLLVVFLRGGYDAANLLVPVSSDYYYEARPTIAIARPESRPNAAIAIDADWGLAPGLDASLLALYRKGEAAAIPFAGIHDVSRSHFDTQDSIELGQPLGATRDFGSGFLNRLAAALAGNGRPMSFTDQLPLVFRGDLQVPNMALRNLSPPRVDARHTEIIRGMYRGTPLESAVDEGFAVRDDVMRGMAKEMDAASRGTYTAKGFELEARRIARLMAERYDVGFVDVGGWDSHIAQGGAKGSLASKLVALWTGIAGFAEEMGPQWRDTVVIVLSEFGRPLRENGNGGTDHGHGSVYWVLGGSLRGGRIVGEQVRVSYDTLFEKRDYPVINEYREVIGGVLARMYGLDGAQMAKVFPGAQPRELGLV